MKTLSDRVYRWRNRLGFLVICALLTSTVAKADVLRPDTLPEVVAYSDFVGMVDVLRVHAMALPTWQNLSSISATIRLAKEIRQSPYFLLPPTKEGELQFTQDGTALPLEMGRYLMFLVQEESGKFRLTGQVRRAYFPIDEKGEVGGFGTWLIDDALPHDSAPLDEAIRIIQAAVIPDGAQTIRAMAVCVARTVREPIANEPYCRIIMTSRDAPGTDSPDQDCPWAYNIAGYCRANLVKPELFTGVNAGPSSHFNVLGRWQEGYFTIEAIIHDRAGTVFIMATDGTDEEKPSDDSDP